MFCVSVQLLITRSALAFQPFVDSCGQSGDIPGTRRNWRQRPGVLAASSSASIPSTAPEEIITVSGEGKGVGSLRFAVEWVGRVVLMPLRNIYNLDCVLYALRQRRTREGVETKCGAHRGVWALLAPPGLTLGQTCKPAFCWGCIYTYDPRPPVPQSDGTARALRACGRVS